ncbi:septal ring lytic transglycosylase RlpA family protein [Hydrogenophaga sp.]|uniref:septal ring lytic transglycosylase RlpA family protein n=1 Tax=Hydrogenophaga sp. TaxID=1904254 RepID=UPI0025C45EDD|nr:septal ring lytic transglycosylase RlpA family protein [Hydrogenophaga sp.]
MSPSRRLATLGLASLVLAGCASSPSRVPSGSTPAEREIDGESEIARGLASWYGEKFQGRRTASGERFDMNALTAAHPSLPFGTRVRVRNARNGREVEVRINDRGPFTGKRIIDLSRAAAQAIDLVQAGVGPVVLLRP